MHVHANAQHSAHTLAHDHACPTKLVLCVRVCVFYVTHTCTSMYFCGLYYNTVRIQMGVISKRMVCMRLSHNRPMDQYNQAKSTCRVNCCWMGLSREVIPKPLSLVPRPYDGLGMHGAYIFWKPTWPAISSCACQRTLNFEPYILLN